MVDDANIGIVQDEPELAVDVDYLPADLDLISGTVVVEPAPVIFPEDSLQSVDISESSFHTDPLVIRENFDPSPTFISEPELSAAPNMVH